MQVVILCGGKGTRLYPLTQKIPKAMVPIFGKPFLYYQIKLFKKNGFANFLLCVGYKGSFIKKYFGDGSKLGVRIVYSDEGQHLLGTAGALKKAEKLLEKEFMVIYGDSYINFNFKKAINFFHKHNKWGLMTVYKNDNKIEPSNVVVKNGYVVYYDKQEKIPEMHYIDYGLSIFKKDILKFVSKQKFIDLSLVFKKLIERKHLLAYPVKKRYYQIGNYKGLREFKSYIKEFLTK